MKGYVHSFESLATLDGEGIRYGVFLQRCHLRCVYCHNPDTWEDRGQEIDSEELVKKVKRYKPYFGDNGGATFSGGEPLLQAEFLKDVALKLSREDINYTIDTSGVVPLTDDVKFVLENAQLIILDLKFWDDESYLRYTGQGISRTLEMLRFLNSKNKRTWIRTVVVPGINDSESVIEKYLENIRDIECIDKYELLGFHTMGFFKYENLGLENRLSSTPALDSKKLQKLQKFIDEKRKSL